MYGQSVRYSLNQDSLFISFNMDENCVGDCNDFKTGIIKTDLLGNIGFSKIYDIDGVSNEYVSQLNVSDFGYYIYGTANYDLLDQKDFVMKFNFDGDFLNGMLISNPNYILNSYIDESFVGGTSSVKNELVYFVTNTNAVNKDIILNAFDEDLNPIQNCFIFENISCNELDMDNYSEDIILNLKTNSANYTNATIDSDFPFDNKCKDIIYDTIFFTQNDSSFVQLNVQNISNPIIYWSNDSTNNQVYFSEHELQVKIIDPYNCCIYLDTFYKNNCKLQLDLGLDVEKCEGTSFEINAPIINEATYLWNTNSQSHTITPIEEGVYWLKISNSNCFVIDSINFVVSKPENCNCVVYLPNTFSPNDDEKNQTFKIVTKCNIIESKLIIYDRWGEILFESYDQNVGWDGTYHNKMVQNGLYFYKVEYSNSFNEKNEFIGHVSVLK